MTNNVVFHVGLPKTGTTTLQHLMSLHEHCLYLGKGFREDGLPSLSRDIATAVLAADVRRFDALVPELRNRIAQYANYHDCVFISDEAFTFAEFMPLVGGRWRRQIVVSHDTIAARLKALAPDARVILSIRNQLPLLESFYVQLSKHQLTDLNFHDFIGVELDWLAYRSMLHTLLYDEVLDAYCGQFAAADILVQVYETFVQDFRQHVQDVCGFSGLDPTTCLNAYDGHAFNERRVESRTLRSAKRYVPKLLKRSISSRYKRGLKRQLSQRARQPTWKDEHRAQLEALFAPANARLADRLSLNLQGLGYPVEPDVGRSEPSWPTQNLSHP